MEDHTHVCSNEATAVQPPSYHSKMLQTNLITTNGIYFKFFKF